VRGKLQEACELISAVSDTIHDEINAPHWRPKLADLGANDAEDVASLLEKSRAILDDPEGFGEDEERKIEEENDGPEGTPNDVPWGSVPGVKEEFSSQLPGAGSPETQGVGAAGPRAKEASGASWWKAADSSLPVGTLSGGPRVDHIGPGEGDGPWGSYNTPEPVPPKDDWAREEGVGLTDPLGIESSSGMPRDFTPTRVDDFGLGFPGDDETFDYGNPSSSGKGVLGPASRLPGSSGDGPRPVRPGVEAYSHVPNDGEAPVARSDTYDRTKGNQFDVTVRAESGLPEGMKAPQTYDRSLPGASGGYQDVAVPYVKRERTFHDDRQDAQELYTYDRTSHV
jgi:hypothetical protein